MEIFSKLAIFTGIILISGCSTNAKITGVASSGQKSVYKDGRQTLVSVKRNTVVVAPESKTVASGNRGNFVVAVKNGGPGDILFSPSNISATAKNSKTGKVVALKVYNYETLVKEEKTRQSWAAVATALQGAADSMNAANAGYSNTYGSYSGTAYNNYGASAYGSGTYSSTTYNSAAALAARNDAQTKSNQRINDLQREGRENLNQLGSRILKKQTVSPNSWHGGIVKMDLPDITESNQDITVLIKMGGENHKFQFSQSKETSN